jgi:hypothetical protein
MVQNRQQGCSPSHIKDRDPASERDEDLLGLQVARSVNISPDRAVKAWRIRRVLRRTMRPASSRLRSMSCLCGVTASAEQKRVL